MKRMHKLIVMSATYQQSSRARPNCSRRTRTTVCWPAARAFGWKRRSSAIPPCGPAACCRRASAARASSRPQPPGVTTEGTYGGLAWKVSPGGDRYRRGLYTFTKRTAPFAMVDDVRRPERRGLCGPPRGVQHAAPGADAAERPGLRRGRTGPRPLAGRSGGPGRGTRRRPVPPLPDPAPSPTRYRDWSAFLHSQKRRFDPRNSTPRRSPGPARATPASAPPGPFWHACCSTSTRRSPRAEP